MRIISKTLFHIEEYIMILSSLPYFQKLPLEIVCLIEEMSKPRNRQERANLLFRECDEIRTKLETMKKIATTEIPFGKYKGYDFHSLDYGKSNFHNDSSYTDWLQRTDVLDKYFFNSEEIREYIRLRFKLIDTEYSARYIMRGNDD